MDVDVVGLRLKVSELESSKEKPTVFQIDTFSVSPTYFEAKPNFCSETS